MYIYDAIIILCGGIYKTTEGAYEPTEYFHSDEFGMLGGKARVLAAVELYLQKRARNFCFSTGVSEKSKAKFGLDLPAEALIYSNVFQKLIADFREKDTALEQPTIFLEAKSVNTASNIREVLELARGKDWNMIAIISSEYHIPRVRALYDSIRNQIGGIKLLSSFLSAEEILKTTRPGKYDTEIEAAYASKAAQLRLYNETQGLKAFRQKKYIFSEYQLYKKK